MADQSDVENALVAAVAPPALAVAATARIYRGWPVPAALDADLAAGLVNVSVYPERGVRRTTRYLDREIDVSTATPSLTVAVSGQVVTFGGTAALGQVAAVQIGWLAFTYRTASGDTPASVAAALAAECGGTASGAALTCGPGVVSAAVYADGAMWTETRMQAQRFRVSIWAPDPATRDAMAIAIDAALAATDWLPLPDQSEARLLYADTVSFDTGQADRLYRRDLRYQCEFSTATTAAAARLAAVVSTEAPTSTNLINADQIGLPH
jgi:hypothetical protein